MQNHEILINQPKQEKYVFSKLSSLLKNENVTEVTFMVAFITVDGVYLILNELQALLKRKVKIVIITGFMNNFNHPKVFELLLRIDNLEIRIAEIEGYHPKLYIIKNGDYISYIIGSSNLTNNALRRNLETNIYMEGTPGSNVNWEISKLYNQIYLNSKTLSLALLDKYRSNFIPAKVATQSSIEIIHPNSMQIKALSALAKLRRISQSKGLIISATGSGKTYLSAFDVKAFGAKRLLFIAHRESILNSAITSYKNVIKGLQPAKLTGKTKSHQDNFIFASIQTLHKDEYLHQFNSEDFDYIVIDEVHRAGALSYRKVINYFKPKFLLGMSATPERNDDFDIYGLFDNNIAHEIRLNEALEEGLICPFHYFGISELLVDNSCLDNYADFNKIDFKQRAKHIIKNIKIYGYDGNKVKGLIFTSTIQEAQQLSQIFNQKGYKTICLSGYDNDIQRESAVNLLSNDYTDAKGHKQDYLDYIFSVDIFNEGIDIPCVNQIVLLRPTQSAIIFTQQLGRGLRKNSGKEYCVIIDFIGNYTSNFLIAIALSGNNSYDKEYLRRFVCEANSMIPTSATISFDEVTRERIYSSINNILINKKFIDRHYLELKMKLNRIPDLVDFKQYNSIDPKLIFKYMAKSGKIIYSNYYELLKKHGDLNETFSEQQLSYLNYISQELLFAARPDEMYILLHIINGVDEATIYTKLCQNYNTFATVEKQKAIKEILSLETSTALQKKYGISLVDMNNARLILSSDFSSNLNQASFKELVIKILQLGLSYFEEYQTSIKYNDFIVYNKYSRKETTRLLNVKLSLETSIYGYRIINNVVPIFITYNKSRPNAINAKYNNIFLNNQDFIWYSRPFTHIDSSEIKQIIQYKENNLTLMILLKKNDHEGSEHYYLGNADIYQFTQEKYNHTNIVKFILRLQTPLTDSYQDYFTN